jgi:hypothetical protein
MEGRRFARIVGLKKGKLKPSEFRIRPGEKGLSLFLITEEVTTETIINAVKDAGKKGELAAAILTEGELQKAGLRMIRTPGGTPDPRVNQLHFEARIPFWKRIWLHLRAVSLDAYFNDTYSPSLFSSAKIPE